MPKTILIEEFHLSVYVPRGLPDAACNAIRRDLNDARFRARLGRTIREFVRQYPSLNQVTVKVSQ